MARGRIMWNKKKRGRAKKTFRWVMGVWSRKNRKIHCKRAGTHDKQKLTDYVENMENHSERIIACKIKLHWKTSLQIVQVYAPTGDHDDETVEMLYKELEKALDRKACSHHIVMGNFNAKIGVRNVNEKIKCTGPLGTGKGNKRRERLLDFAKENNLVVTNGFGLMK